MKNDKSNDITVLTTSLGELLQPLVAHLNEHAADTNICFEERGSIPGLRLAYKKGRTAMIEVVGPLIHNGDKAALILADLLEFTGGGDSWLNPKREQQLPHGWPLRFAVLQHVVGIYGKTEALTFLVAEVADKEIDIEAIKTQIRLIVDFMKSAGNLTSYNLVTSRHTKAGRPQRIAENDGVRPRIARRK